MRDFTLYIEDERYKIATLRLVTAGDERLAREMAISCLGESSHHLAVEVCEEGRLLFKVARDETSDGRGRILAS
jgi:hypothetical protein